MVSACFALSVFLHILLLGFVPDVSSPAQHISQKRLVVVIAPAQTISSGENQAAYPTETSSEAATQASTQAAETVRAQPSAATASAPASEGTSPGTTASNEVKYVDGLAHGPWYYAARYLHRRVTPVRTIKPEFPPVASVRSGKVKLLLFVNQTGGVDLYRIVSSEPSGVFDQSVIEAFASARYDPGRIAGQAVKAQLLVEVSFESDGSTVTTFSDPGESAR